MIRILAVISFLLVSAFSTAQEPKTLSQVNSGSSCLKASPEVKPTFTVGTIYIKLNNVSDKHAEQPVVVNDLLFTPNPVKDYLTFEGKEIKHISIFDLNGRLVLETDVKGQTVNIGALPKGCYVIMTDANTSKGYKLLKE